MAPRPLALRFLSGRYQGGVVPLEPGRALVLGRGPDVDLAIPEDLASRRHARLAFEGDALVVEDLGSTNGTYVNGARITRARLGEGDRVLVGGVILRVVPREGGPAASVAEVRAGLERAADTAEPRKASAMQGRVEEIPVADLLQLCSTSKKSGTLVVEGGGHAAEVRLDKGRVVGCTLDARPDLPPDKCFYRLLAFTVGHFELRPGDPPAGAAPAFSASLEGLLMDGMRQIDELRRLWPTLPPRFAPGPQPPPPELGAEERAILALARAHGTLQGVLDHAPLTDLDAAQRVAAMLARGVLVPA